MPTPLSLFSFSFSFSSFFILLLFPLHTNCTIQNRRTLHEPFFSLPSPPLPSPPSPNPIPKYPSSSNPQPFFPSFPSPPPASPSSQQPTFPANITSLIFPNSQSAPPHHSSSTKLVPAILLPLLTLSVLALSIAFFFNHRRRGARSASDRAESHRLFPPDSAHSDSRKRAPVPAVAAPGPPSSEFLYLGTLVDSRGRHEEEPDPQFGSPYRKLASPELHPLPPLSRQCRYNADVALTSPSSSEEEFYSPRGSSTGRANSSSRRSFPTAPSVAPATMEKCGSHSSTLSTPSYPSSNLPSPTRSSPPLLSSPGQSSRRSFKLRSESNRTTVNSVPPPPPPPVFPVLRPLTPSPPKRKLPASPSPPSSPLEKDSDRNSRNSNSRISDYAGPPTPPAKQANAPPPPPPPPPPPVGYWENQVRKPAKNLPPTLSPEKSIGLKTATSEELESCEKNEETPRPKLKPLHWDKVRASSDRAMVWDQLRSSSFQVNEEMMETLFVCNTNTTANTAAKEAIRRPAIPLPKPQENRVLDPKKSQNIAILLRALNVTKEEVCEALTEGKTDNLGAELLETLLKMGPSKEEEIKLREYREDDDSPTKLGPAERFLKALIDIPFAFKRVDAMLYIANFDSEVKYLKKSFDTLEAACEELRSSRLFLKLLEAVLKTGNRMNVGTNRGDAHAFKLDTLLTLVDVKGTDGKTTLLHFVVQEIIRSEGSRLSPTINPQQCTPKDDVQIKKLGLQAVAGLANELTNVKKAAAMDSDVLSSYVAKLAGGITKITDVLRLNKDGGRFNESMNAFLKRAEDEIIKVQAQESVALSLVKEITEYFHGDSAKEEAHPFRIFMVVRDFLGILDKVCKEVGRVNGRTTVSSGRQFPVPINPTLPPIFPRFGALRAGSSDDESS